MSTSATLPWQPSATSLHPTLYSKSWSKCPMRWALTIENQANCVTIIQPIQTIFAAKIAHCFFSAILFIALSSSCNNLRSGNICHLLQYRNSMMLRNISTQSWIQPTGGGMNGYVRPILSQRQWFWLLQYLWRPLAATIVLLSGSSDRTHLPDY